jgi:hypothetical protein
MTFLTVTSRYAGAGGSSGAESIGRICGSLQILPSDSRHIST